MKQTSDPLTSEEQPTHLNETTLSQPRLDLVSLSNASHISSSLLHWAHGAVPSKQRSHIHPLLLPRSSPTDQILAVLLEPCLALPKLLSAQEASSYGLKLCCSSVLPCRSLFCGMRLAQWMQVQLSPVNSVNWKVDYAQQSETQTHRAQVRQALANRKGFKPHPHILLCSYVRLHDMHMWCPLASLLDKQREDKAHDRPGQLLVARILVWHANP